MSETTEDRVASIKRQHHAWDKYDRDKGIDPNSAATRSFVHKMVATSGTDLVDVFLDTLAPWLKRIEAVREPFRGYWQTTDYGYWDPVDDRPVRRALAEIKLKSIIARPRVYETLLPNRLYNISSVNGTHLNSKSWTFFSMRRYSGKLIFHGLV